jgi:hypothetical protein
MVLYVKIWYLPRFDLQTTSKQLPEHGLFSITMICLNKRCAYRCIFLNFHVFLKTVHRLSPPLLCLVFLRSIYTFDSSVINGGDKSYVEYQWFTHAKMRVNSRWNEPGCRYLPNDNPGYPNESTFLIFNLGELEKGHNNLPIDLRESNELSWQREVQNLTFSIPLKPYSFQTI